MRISLFFKQRFINNEPFGEPNDKILDFTVNKTPGEKYIITFKALQRQVNEKRQALATLWDVSTLESSEEILSQEIDELPERTKLIIMLYYYEEMTITEIAKILNLAKSTVSEIHTKALIKLRSRLRKKLKEI